jgi:hypothetical protein
MRATYNGITMEGTPKEIAELKRLLDEQLQLSFKPQQAPFVPWTPYWSKPIVTSGPTWGAVTYTNI